MFFKLGEKPTSKKKNFQTFRAKKKWPILVSGTYGRTEPSVWWKIEVQRLHPVLHVCFHQCRGPGLGDFQDFQEILTSCNGDICGYVIYYMGTNWMTYIYIPLSEVLVHSWLKKRFISASISIPGISHRKVGMFWWAHLVSNLDVECGPCGEKNL